MNKLVLCALSATLAVSACKNEGSPPPTPAVGEEIKPEDRPKPTPVVKKEQPETKPAAKKETRPFGEIASGVTKIDVQFTGKPAVAVTEQKTIGAMFNAIGTAQKPESAWPKCMSNYSLTLYKGEEKVGTFGNCGGVIRHEMSAYKVADVEALEKLLPKK